MNWSCKVDDRANRFADLNLRPGIPQPPVRPDIIDWIQSRLTGDRRVPYITPADVYYTGTRLSEAEKLQDKRWEATVPRTLMFKQFFGFLKPSTTAVQMVEAMRDAGITPLVLDSLPEAVLIPLRDAISLCQPLPPTSWSKDLLELVDRKDISLILAPGKRPKPSVSKILVRLYGLLEYLFTNAALDTHTYCNLGLQAAMPKRGRRQHTWL